MPGSSGNKMFYSLYHTQVTDQMLSCATEDLKVSRCCNTDRHCNIGVDYCKAGDLQYWICFGVQQLKRQPDTVVATLDQLATPITQFTLALI